MRRHAAGYLLLVAAAALAAAGLLSACGSQQASRPTVAAVQTRSAPDSFSRRARLVVERWNRSRAASLWDNGLVLTGQEQLVQIPPNAGFDSQRQKDMFFSGHFSLATRFPAGSPGDVVRWASGATLRLPVLDARAAFAELATRTPCGGPYRCSSLGDLSVVSMRPTTVALPTSRGLAQVPAWQFRVAQLSWPFTEAAVVPRALLVLPSAFNAQAGGPVAVSKNGRELTLTAAVGACTGQPPPRVAALVYETAGVVVVGTRVTYGASSFGTCAGVELIERFRATLARPLGSRVVLDVGSGQPLANESPQ
jgi:hypothetical protein